MSQLILITLRLLPVIPKMLPVLTKEQGQSRVREVLGMLLERRPSRANLVTPTGYDAIFHIRPKTLEIQ